MNKKLIITLSLILLTVSLFLLFSFNNPNKTELPKAADTTKITPETSPTLNPTPSTSPTPATNFTATFEIYTNGTKRIFTDSKYHNQSEQVYIQPPNPSQIHVLQADITWDDFFKTLPFSLKSDCLITGTKQTFCTTDTQKLRFYINGLEVPTALETKIQPNDSLKVFFN